MSARRRIGAALLGVVLFPGLAVLGLDRGWWRLNHPDTTRFPVWGIDVSHHQGAIDWSTVARQPRIAFAYLKATEGGDWTDPRFATNWRAARAAGLRVGAYHFFTFCRSPLDQAEHFLAVLPAERDTLPPAVDVELGGNCELRRPATEVTADLETWIDVVEARTGRRALVYATGEAVEAFLTKPKLTRNLWIRDVWSSPNRRWTLWQFANRARLPGIETFVDLNVLRGAPSVLDRL